jgi:1-acyl-sn-glycerol-3-phosphate acyltransferase
MKPEKKPKKKSGKKKPPARKSIPAPAPMVDEESVEATAAPVPEDSQPSKQALDEIRELEQRLERMIDDARQSQTQLPSELDDEESIPTMRMPPKPSSPTLGEESVFDTARELLSTDYYLRQWGRIGMRNRSEEVDDFGYDPIYDQRLRPVFDFLYERYFRVAASGVERVPATGRCLLVANHSGTLPLDGIMIKMAVKREHPQKRDVRWLAEDFVFHFPFLGSASNRIGAVRACQENAERLLAQDSLVAVFPEGVKGIGKLFRERYKLQRFGRGGFVKLCLRTRTPIIPVAVVGAEETNPMLARLEGAAKAIGIPYLPITPTFPLLGPLGLLPAPTKWTIAFGEMMSLDEYGPESADDEILVGRLAEQVRSTIQGMLDRSVAGRRSVWTG